MALRPEELFTMIRTEGGLLPPDLLARLVASDARLEGLTPDAYHLAGRKSLNEAISGSWANLTAAWADFRARLAERPESDQATGLVRERWLLPLFAELGYGRLQPVQGAVTVGDKKFALSHLWQRTPIHLVGARVDLDRRTAGVAGAARTSPHGLVQELLNASDEFLWGFVSNGLRLRILRDSASLTRQAYVEFDLEAMFDGEVYSDFVVLWLLAHQSRVEPRGAAPALASDAGKSADGETEEATQAASSPADCWLERWSRLAQEQGTRALEALRDGVEQAIAIPGRGFLEERRNEALRDALREGRLSKHELYRQLLRLVYRLLFLFVAEDRDLLLVPTAPPEAKERYRRWYSTARLRRLAGSRCGGPHHDLYETLRLVMAELESDEGCPELALPALGSFLWSPQAIPALAEATLANRALLDALCALAFDTRDGALRPVDFRNLGAEELGSVYESLLELEPEIDLGAQTFELATVSGSERKTTGSYYTPSSLIQSLLETALDPVLAEAAAKDDAEQAILVRIPTESEHPFRAKPNTDSGGRRTAVSTEGEH